MFKVGDKVTVVNAYIDTHLMGKTLPVTKVEGNRVWVEGSTSSWSTPLDGWLELAKKSKIKGGESMQINQVQVGKTYRVRNDSSVPCGSFRTSRTGASADRVRITAKNGVNLSYEILSSTGARINSCNCNGMEKFLLPLGKQAPAKYILTFNVRSGSDPYVTFSTDKQLSEWLVEAGHDSNIILDSVIVYTIAAIKKMKLNWELV